MTLHQILISDNDNQSLPDAAIHNQKLFGGDFRFWDNAKIEKLLRDNFSYLVLDAYHTLLPYAYKADLARYCILHTYGGWYVDLNIQMTTVPDVGNADLLLIRDYNNGNRMAPWQLANGLVYAAAPKHPVFQLAIDTVILHCIEKYYGKRTLSPTGPELFGRAIAAHGWDHERNNYLVGDFVDGPNNRKQFTLFNKQIAIHKTLPGGEVGIAGTNNYVEMWHNREVYKD